MLGFEGYAIPFGASVCVKSFICKKRLRSTYRRTMNGYTAYIICTSPRSGSTLLCRVLSEAGNAGVPESYFHESSLSEWLLDYGLDQTAFVTSKDALEAVFLAAVEEGKGKSEVFGLRLQRQSAAFFLKQLEVLFPFQPDDMSRIEAAFGKTLLVHLTRENKLDQAISYVRAQQSGLWHMAPDGTEIERLSHPKDSLYDRAAIERQLVLSEQMDEEWCAWFDREGVRPVRITYEELAADPYATVRDLLAKLGHIQEQKAGGTPPTVKLADETNQEWARRFLAERHHR